MKHVWMSLNHPASDVGSSAHQESLSSGTGKSSDVLGDICPSLNLNKVQLCA